jgi:hypothetical protein
MSMVMPCRVVIQPEKMRQEATVMVLSRHQAYRVRETGSVTALAGMHVSLVSPMMTHVAHNCSFPEGY